MIEVSDGASLAYRLDLDPFGSRRQSQGMPLPLIRCQEGDNLSQTGHLPNLI